MATKKEAFSMRGGAGVFQDRIWLDKYKITGNYYYRTSNWGTIGSTVAYVNLWGQGDPLRTCLKTKWL